MRWLSAKPTTKRREHRRNGISGEMTTNNGCSLYTARGEREKRDKSATRSLRSRSFEQGKCSRFIDPREKNSKHAKFLDRAPSQSRSVELRLCMCVCFCFSLLRKRRTPQAEANYSNDASLLAEEFYDSFYNPMIEERILKSYFILLLGVKRVIIWNCIIMQHNHLSCYIQMLNCSECVICKAVREYLGPRKHAVKGIALPR